MFLAVKDFVRKSSSPDSVLALLGAGRRRQSQKRCPGKPALHTGVDLSMQSVENKGSRVLAVVTIQS